MLDVGCLKLKMDVQLMRFKSEEVKSESEVGCPQSVKLVLLMICKKMKRNLE